MPEWLKSVLVHSLKWVMINPFIGSYLKVTFSQVAFFYSHQNHHPS